jgi:hypothetical protein
MRLSRGCYDKFHRCPGWAGGGLKYAKEDRCLHGGLMLSKSQGDPKYKRLWKFRFMRCDTCDVIVLPYYSKYLSVFWLWTIFKSRREWRKINKD